MRSVWSRVASGSITVVSPGGMQAGDQHGRLDLRRRHRQLVLDRDQIGACRGCVSGSVSPAPSSTSQPHLPQRLEHPAHRSPRQRGIAGQAHGHVVAGDHAHHQAHAGAGIAEIEVACRLLQAAHAAAQHLPDAVRLGDRAAQRLQGPGGAQDILALEQAGDARAAGRQRPEHEGAVRDRLVARHADAARQGLRPVGASGDGAGCGTSGGLDNWGPVSVFAAAEPARPS